LAAASGCAAVWMRRLYAAGPALDAAEAQLHDLATTRLVSAVPVLGSTLSLLRAQRRAEGGA